MFDPHNPLLTATNVPDDWTRDIQVEVGLIEYECLPMWVEREVLVRMAHAMSAVKANKSMRGVIKFTEGVPSDAHFQGS